MTRRHRHRYPPADGFTLIEVLVALVVITVGMLGVAVLYVEGLRMNRTSLYRTTAVAFATDMSERIRANQGDNRGADYAGTGPGQPGNCDQVVCTSAELAAEDWWQWNDALSTYLPAGTEAEITRPAPVNGMQPFNITLRWPEIGSPNPATYTLTMQLSTMKTRPRQTGMTLIEAMVAMTISSVLIIGSISMYSQARNNYRTTESVARMQENLRFSIDILDEDVRLAGYWGKAAGASRMTGFTDIAILCGGTDVSDWALSNNGNRVDPPIAALQDADELPDGCKGTGPRGASDVLIVRRASTLTSEPTNGVVQIQSSVGSGSFFDSNADPGSPAVAEKINHQVNDVEFSAYYVSDRSKYDPDLPALRRLTLAGNTIEDRELIPGVENLQVQFGIDSNGDGRIDMYVNGDEVGTSNIISARVWMLVRAENNEAGQGYEDNRGPYQAPDDSLAPIDPLGDDADLYPPTYRRMALSRTIVLRNSQ